MDGVTALRFVRSRHAEGDEGTDFARSQRQQLVMKAVKDKAFSSETILSPQKIEDVYAVLKENVYTDVAPGEMNALAKIVLKYRAVPTKTFTLGLDDLVNPPIDERGWILLPKDNSWTRIHRKIKEALELPQ